MYTRRSRRSLFQTPEDMRELTFFSEPMPRMVILPEEEDVALPQPQSMRLNKPIHDYKHALRELGATLRELYSDEAKQHLLFAGFGVYREVVKLTSQKKRNISEKTLTAILNSTRFLLLGKEQHPTGATGYKNEITHYFKLAKKVSQASLGQAIAGLMLSLLSIAIIVASGFLALASFGVLAPISVLGFVFGHSLLVAAATTVTTCVVGTSAIMGSAAVFFNSVKKGALAEEMHSVVTSVRK